MRGDTGEHDVSSGFRALCGIRIESFLAQCIKVSIVSPCFSSFQWFLLLKISLQVFIIGIGLESVLLQRGTCYFMHLQAA